MMPLWYDGLGNGTKLIIGTIGTAAGVFGFTAEGIALSEAVLYGASTVVGSSAFSATVNVVESAFKNWFAGESYTTAGEDWTHSFLNSYGIDGFLFGISGLRYSGSGSAASTAKVTESYCANNIEEYKIVNGFEAKVNAGKQGKHILGHNNYIQGKSIFNGTAEDAQKLLNEFAGKGKWLGTNREWVDFGKPIGQFYDINTGKYMETTKGFIHYSSKGGAHIVPSNPSGKW